MTRTPRPPAYMRHARDGYLPLDVPKPTGSHWPLCVAGFFAFAMLGAFVAAALLRW